MKYEEIKTVKNDLWEMEQSLKRRNKFESILKLYVAIGALLGFLSLSYFLLSLIEIELTKTQMLALLSGGISITTSVLSWVLLVYRRQREQEEVEKIRSFQKAAKLIQLWAEFEYLSKQKLVVQGFEFKTKSIHSTINALVQNGLIEPYDLVAIEKAMQLRNMLAHSHMDTPIDNESIEEVYDALMRVIHKLSE